MKLKEIEGNSFDDVIWDPKLQRHPSNDFHLNPTHSIADYRHRESAQGCLPAAKSCRSPSSPTLNPWLFLASLFAFVPSCPCSTPFGSVASLFAPMSRSVGSWRNWASSIRFLSLVRSRKSMAGLSLRTALDHAVWSHQVHHRSGCLMALFQTFWLSKPEGV